MMRRQSPYVVGIDLGTSNSSISACVRGMPRTILLQGKKSLPSVVQFRNGKKDSLSVGENAKKYTLVKPEEVFSSFKPWMKSDAWREDEDLKKKLTIEDQQLTPTHLGAEILRELISRATNQDELDLKGTIRRAIICVPANTTDEYRNNVYQAAAMAGLGDINENGEVMVDDQGRPKGVMLLEEPTAAAIAYGHELGIFSEKKKQTIMVYDLGGGTFDVTLLGIDTNAQGTPTFKVLNTKGVAQLGGDDFDQVLMKMCAEKFNDDHKIDIFDLKSDYGITPKSLKQAQQKLKAHCEDAKIQLASGSSQVEVLDAVFLVDENGKQLNLEVEIKKSAYVEKIQPLLELAGNCVRETLEEKNMSLSDVSRVILVGGSTKAPWVIDSIKAMYPSGEERAPYSAKDVDVIVSQGAALYGASQTTPVDNEAAVELELSSIVSHHLGIETPGQEFGLIMEKGLPLDDATPLQSATRIFVNQENQDTVQLMVWKTQKNMDLEEKNGIRLPKDRQFIDEHDSQGNRLFECIGEFTLKGVPKAPRGREQIEVSLILDKENLLRVSAKILSSGSGGELGELSVDRA